MRRYQVDAIAAWKQNGYRGILAMATGTGKTVTSLSGARQCLDENPEVSAVLVVVPFVHLADQWADQLAEAGFNPIRAYDASAAWKAAFATEERHSRLLKRPICVLTTYKTLGTLELRERLAPIAQSLLLIADECHYLGAESTREFLHLDVRFRLGLSATPQRHFDEAGKKALSTYFGGIVFEFGLADAITAGYLTPYKYFPEAVELTSSEYVKYENLTVKIGRAMAASNATSGFEDEYLQNLLRQRARLVNNAENKVTWLREQLKTKSRDELRYTLVYTGDLLFDRVLETIGAELKVPVHAFTAMQSRKERASILRQFQAGELSILVAMRCLDEGVDVPPTRTAYFLASTSNPREFVQRRGRILRTSPGKEHAVVHDAVSVPPGHSRSGALDSTEAATMRSQLNRIQEFASQAMNKAEALQALFDLRIRANLPLDLRDEDFYS